MSAAPAEVRGHAQRQRILAAAEKCFIEHGFHAASVASIADTAQMSPGLIYRYFSSKNEIILAIIEQQLQLARQEMRRQDARANLAQQIAESFAPDCGGQQTNAALFLEISAEATRDAAIGVAVRNSDHTLETDFREWLQRDAAAGGYGLDAEQARGAALVLQCLWEGMKVREARQPDFDHEALQAALLQCLPALLQP